MPRIEPSNVRDKRSRGHCVHCFTPYGCVSDFRGEPCPCHIPMGATCAAPSGCGVGLFVFNPLSLRPEAHSDNLDVDEALKMIRKAA